MNQSLRGLLVAAVPATLGLLFGLGVIFYSIDHKTTQEASASADSKQGGGASTQAAGGGSSSEIAGFVKQNCATCHGADLKGMVGPKLAGISLSEDEIVNVLKNGKNGRMPAGLATGKEAEVAKYLKSLK